MNSAIIQSLLSFKKFSIKVLVIIPQFSSTNFLEAEKNIGSTLMISSLKSGICPVTLKVGWNLYIKSIGILEWFKKSPLLVFQKY
jgi:hypothetical protein